MVIGTLTFYRGLNYGAILQAFALRKILLQMGHEVHVIGRTVKAEEQPSPNVVMRCKKLLIGCLRMGYGIITRNGTIGNFLRKVRTKAFVRKNLNVTAHRLMRWADYEDRNMFDMVIVGSDQVWHVDDNHAPGVYLLEGAPAVRAISYAASFGMKEIPLQLRREYALGFSRFFAISVREKSGIELVHECGCRAVHVVDPTLLMELEDWHELVNEKVKPWGERSRKLVCYFLSEDLATALPQLKKFALSNHIKVEVFVDGSCLLCRTVDGLAGNWVRIRFDAGPAEFVKSFSKARWCLTDSFHGSVFAYTFNLDLKVIRPLSTHWRAQMFARIEEFCGVIGRRELIRSSVRDAIEALDLHTCPCYYNERILAKRNASLEFLKNALKGCAA